MTQTDANVDAPPDKGSKLPLILSLVFALIGGGGGFYLTWSGLLLGPGQKKVENVGTESVIPDMAYIPIDPMVISLRKPTKSNHLRFRAQLEVHAQYKADVEKLMPRVTDVLNTYLRAVKVEDFDDPGILIRLRSQMLHRVNVVVGQRRVNNLLIMEFVFT